MLQSSLATGGFPQTTLILFVFCRWSQHCSPNRWSIHQSSFKQTNKHTLGSDKNNRICSIRSNWPMMLSNEKEKKKKRIETQLPDDVLCAAGHFTGAWWWWHTLSQQLVLFCSVGGQRMKGQHKQKQHISTTDWPSIGGIKGNDSARSLSA